MYHSRSKSEKDTILGPDLKNKVDYDGKLDMCKRQKSKSMKALMSNNQIFKL